MNKSKISYASEIKENGFCIIPNYYDETEIKNMLSDIEKIFDVSIGGLNVNRYFSGLDEKYLFLKNEHNELKSRCYDFLGKLASINRGLNKKIISDIANELYKSPVVMDNCQVRIDDSSSDRDLPMHQELNQVSMFNLTVWVPLVDCLSNEQGGLEIVPKSHNRGLLKHQLYDSYSYSGIDESVVIDQESEWVPVGKGGAVVFHPYLIHGTLSNKSDKVRWTTVARFNELNHIDYLKNKKSKFSHGYNIDGLSQDYKDIIFP